MYLLWIRHGFSCANFLGTQDPFYVLTGTMEYDARLTGVGIKQAEKTASIVFTSFKEKLKPIPLIFSSMLSRAIETSHGINQGLVSSGYIEKPFPIVVIPYVEEIPLSSTASSVIYLDKQNEPRNIYEVQKDLGIDVEIYDEINPYDDYGNPKARVNTEKFYEDSLPKILALLEKEGYEVNENTVITIVSHRKTIEKATGANLGNVGAVLQEINEDSGDFQRGPTEILFKGYSTKESLENIQKDDLKNGRSGRAMDFF